MALQPLISELKSAHEGTRELDASIACEIYRKIGAAAVWCSEEVYIEMGPDEYGGLKCPYYTTSLDAALTLVPKGPWNGEISWNWGGATVGGYVELNKANPAWLKDDYDYNNPPDEHAACVNSYENQDKYGAEYIKPRPFALALCIAALKAIALDE